MTGRMAIGESKVVSIPAAGKIAIIVFDGAAGQWVSLGTSNSTISAVSCCSSSRVAIYKPDGTTLLAPFDSVLWYRERVARLFGFSYRIEVYTPGDERVHGYYTLPILHDGALIGRVDAKTHRPERRLEVRHVHLEPWFAVATAPPAGGRPLDQAAAFAGLAEALRSLATFVGATSLTVGRVTPGRLRRTIVTAASP